MAELHQRFRPEFLNRLDEIIMFRPLGKNEISKIIYLLMSEMNERLKQQDIRIRLTQSACDFIVEEGYEPNYGARPLKRFLQKHVETLVAKLLLGDQVEQGDLIEVDVVDGEFNLKVKKELRS